MQPLTSAAENIPTIQPLVVRFPELDAVNCVEFSADGKTLYAEIPAEVLDLGQVVLNWGVWLGVAVVVLLTLAAAFAFWRIAQKPRTKGTLYCRKCNYEVGPTLDGGGTQCTECGTAFSAKRPILGRAPWRRRIPALVMAVLALAGAAALAVPQSRKAALNWAAAKAGVSRSLFVQLNKRSVSIPASLVQQGVMLLELDATTGNRIRTIRTRGIDGRAFGGMRLMPDGTLLLLGASGGVQCVRLHDGKTLATFKPIGDNMEWDLGRSLFQGFCDDGISVLLTYWENGSEVARLDAWTPATGAVRTIATSAYEMRQVPVGNVSVLMDYGRELKVRTRDEAGNVTSVVSAPGFMEAFNNKSYFMESIDVATGKRTTWDLGSKVDTTPSPQITADGTKAFVTVDHGDSILGFDPSNGTLLGRLSSKAGPGGQHTLFNQDRWLFVPGMRNSRIRDIDQKRWIADLSFPPGSFAPKTAMSRKSDRIAAVMMTPRTPPKRTRGVRRSFDLVIWDLSPLHSVAPSTDTEPAP